MNVTPENYTILVEALREIGQYKGEGGPGTPWKDIVRFLGEKAREALIQTNEPLN